VKRGRDRITFTAPALADRAGVEGQRESLTRWGTYEPRAAGEVTDPASGAEVARQTVRITVRSDPLLASRVTARWVLSARNRLHDIRGLVEDRGFVLIDAEARL